MGLEVDDEFGARGPVAIDPAGCATALEELSSPAVVPAPPPLLVPPLPAAGEGVEGRRNKYSAALSGSSADNLRAFKHFRIGNSNAAANAVAAVIRDAGCFAFSASDSSSFVFVVPVFELVASLESDELVVDSFGVVVVTAGVAVVEAAVS